MKLKIFSTTFAVLNLALDIEILRKLKTVITMAGKSEERIKAAIANLNEVTNNIADNMKALQTQIDAGTVSDESLGLLEQDIAKLQNLGTQQDTTGSTPPVDENQEPAPDVTTSPVGGPIPGDDGGAVIGGDGSTVVTPATGEGVTPVNPGEAPATTDGGTVI